MNGWMDGLFQYNYIVQISNEIAAAIHDMNIYPETVRHAFRGISVWGQ